MNAALVMRSSCGAERIFPVRIPRTIIGRESRCHVRIALPSVSGRHCELKVADGSVHINDLRSESGTFLNGRRVERATLSHEDRLTIGPVTFTVRLRPATFADGSADGSAAHVEQHTSQPIVNAAADGSEQDAPAPEIVSFNPQKQRESASAPQRHNPPPGAGDTRDEPAGA